MIGLLMATFPVLGVSPKAEAMGGASTAAYCGALSAYYNPALVALGEGKEGAVSYTLHYLGLTAGSLSTFSAGVSAQLPQFSASFIFTRFGVSGIVGTEVEPLYSENAIYLTGARTFANVGLSAGATVKVLNVGYARNAYTENDPYFASGFSKWGITLDLGAFYSFKVPVVEKIDAGLSLQNIVPANMAVGENATDYVPVVVRAGFFTSYQDLVSGSLDLLYRMKEGLKISLGITRKVGPVDVFGGFWTGYSTGVSVGVGYARSFEKMNVEVNYAGSLDFGVFGFGTHRVSVGVKF